MAGGATKSDGRIVLVFAAVIVGAAAVQTVFRLGPPEPPHTPRPLPELLVEGWLNTDTPPTRDALLGKWVALELWTTWCGPCRAEAPRLVRLHRSLIAGRDDVRLIGLCTDPNDTPAAIQSFMAELPGYDWPVGHGAALMPEVLDAPFVPTFVLFAPDGQSVWRGHSVDGLEKQLRKRLESE